MAAYLLYIPGATCQNADQLKAVGLEALGPDCEWADCFDGPDRGRGKLALYRTLDPETDPGWTVNACHWTPAKADKARGLAAGRFWLGQHRERPVRPCDIVRRQFTAGYGIDLQDGNVWVIPAAVNLPHRHGLDDDGEYSRVIDERFRAFWESSQAYAVQFFQAIDRLDLLKGKEQITEFTLGNAWSFCCQALALNYRLTPELVDALGLLDDAGMRNIIKAAIDLPCILEDRNEKKKETVTIPVG